MADLPEWFQKSGNPVYLPDSDLTSKKIRFLFLDRTLNALAKLFAEYIFSEAHAKKGGILQRLDARFKLLGVMLFVICTSLLHFLPFIYGLYGLALLLALISRIEAWQFIKRVWLVLPFFVGLIALPATLNIFTPGDPLLTIYTFAETHHIGPYVVPANIAVTRQGIFSALFLVGRVATSVSFVLLLTMTTPWSDLLKALRSVGIPQIYVQTLAMTLRYLMHFSQIVQETHIAKKSRMIRMRNPKEEQGWIAGQIGTLFKRSMQMSNEVHRAMTARGYQGEVRILNVFRIKKWDYVWVTICGSLSGVLLYFGR